MLKIKNIIHIQSFIFFSIGSILNQIVLYFNNNSENITKTTNTIIIIASQTAFIISYFLLSINKKKQNKIEEPKINDIENIPETQIYMAPSTTPYAQIVPNFDANAFDTSNIASNSQLQMPEFKAMRNNINNNNNINMDRNFY
jgi:hypothetical protein